MDLKEKYKNARAFVVLLAALISWILLMRSGRSLENALLLELIVIIIFYVIASVAIKLIDMIRNIESRPTTDVDLVVTTPEENSENTEENAGE